MRRVALALALVLGSCGGTTEKKPVDEVAALGGDVAARVGSEVVPAALVGRVATAQKIAPQEALRRIVDDAIAAESAKSRGLDKVVPASWLLVAARARFTADKLTAEARAKGPPTDDEVRRLSELHWREVDRPPSIKVAHVVVLRPKAPADVPAAKALAQAIHDAVVSAPTPEAFLEAAAAVPHPKEIEVKPETLPQAFCDDGAMVEANGGYDPAFAKGAFTLTKPGDTSGVVESSFGWHVIRLLQTFPEQRMPFEQRRAAFQDEVIATRAHDALFARLEPMRANTPIGIASNAEQLMRLVRIAEP